MRKIKLMGKEYNEEMINVLSDYDRFMSDALLDKVRDDGYINVFELVDTRNRYMDELSEEDKAVIKHFIDSTTMLFNRKPVFDITLDIIGIVLACLIGPFIIKLILSVILAGTLTVNISMLSDKIACKKIMKLIAQKCNETR